MVVIKINETTKIVQAADFKTNYQNVPFTAGVRHQSITLSADIL